MRKLASIRKIDAIEPIKGADAIEVAIIGGWKVVVAKDQFSVGHLVIMCEIDSWIPHGLAPFLSKGKEPREYNGVKGERLRTVKLRGTTSQGLLLPLDILGSDTLSDIFDQLEEGFDLTEIMGIQKWEAPIPAQLSGMAKGNFPSWVPTTDQERVQNLDLENLSEMNVTWEVTEKLDGCLFEGTIISTPDGGIPIQNIKVGDRVMSFNHDTASEEESVVTGILHREVETEWFEIETDTGDILTVTANHPVFLPELSCYRRADQLIIGDALTEKV